jgi:hypothetical protein
MYCKACGQEITENSTFCSQCGALQKNTQTVEGHRKQKTTRVKDFLDLDKPHDKIQLGIYLFWFALNVLFLAIGLSAGDEGDHSGFFPFSERYGRYITTYDLTEFMFYTIVPVLLYIVYKLVGPFLVDEFNNE